MQKYSEKASKGEERKVVGGLGGLRILLKNRVRVLRAHVSREERVPNLFVPRKLFTES